MSRVVVTGMGMVTSLGNDVASTWEALCQGKSGVSLIEGYEGFSLDQFRVKIGAQIKNFDPLLYMDRKEVRRNDPYEQLAIASSKQALAQARLDITDENADDVGVYIGSGIGGLVTLHDSSARCLKKDLTASAHSSST
jgi:3-oxoacyl-[acyl-carrier-protein] synthase II